MFDTADLLKADAESEDAGNRTKVELVAESIAGKEMESKFAAFVDREFRKFEIENEITDPLGAHWAQGRLVWSRGHSIENYFFDYSILEPILRASCSDRHFRQALDLYRQVFGLSLRLAAGLSLFAFTHNISNEVVESAIDWSVFRINSTSEESSVTLDHEAWQRALKTRVEDSEEMSRATQSWLKKCESLEYNLARWIAHGHIGIRTMWAIFATVVYSTSLSNGETPREALRDARSVLRMDKNTRINTSVEHWVRKAIKEGYDHPRELFQLLQLQWPT